MDSTVVFLPFDGLSAENHRNSSFIDISASQSNEVRLVVEAIVPVRKMSRVRTFFRYAVSDSLICQRLWFAIDISVTILLCVLYYTQIIPFSASMIAACELLFLILVQNEIFITLLIHCLKWIPFLKYELHRTLHHIGGFHDSSAIGAFLWLLISLVFEDHGLIVRITGAILLLFIIFLSLMTWPSIRHHIEYLHRYLGWTCLIVLIIHVLFLRIDIFNSFTMKAIFNVPVLVLLVIFIIVLLPWRCIGYKQSSKELTVVAYPRVLNPSDSTTPILFEGHEWHQYPILVDHRTNKSVDYVWMRQINGLDFLHSIHAYRKVLIVCTGSDIVAVLPYLKERLSRTHIHLLWIGEHYQSNYGESICRFVEQTSPHFTLHDPTRDGQANCQLIEYYFWKTSSEAVFILSNEDFTDQVMRTLCRKGIDCFGGQ